jgi:hypothetical protein
MMAVDEPQRQPGARASERLRSHRITLGPMHRLCPSHGRVAAVDAWTNKEEATCFCLCPKSLLATARSRKPRPEAGSSNASAAQWVGQKNLCPLSSALCPLPSVLCPLSSALCPLPSVLCPLSSALCPLPRAAVSRACAPTSLRAYDASYSTQMPRCVLGVIVAALELQRIPART